MSTSLYRRIADPSDIRAFDDALFAEHPKRALWEPYTPPPVVVDPDPPIYKEDLIRRAIARGKYAELRTAIAALTNAEQFYFTHVATFTKDDPVYTKIKAEFQKL